MRNFDKYKTTEERAKAFFKQYVGTIHNAIFAFSDWLDLEAEEERPLPCPFCGNQMGIQLCSEGVWYRCRTHNCYCSPCRETKAAAVELHNRLCRAVAKYEKGEGK